MQEFFETYHLPWLLKASWQAAVLILLVLTVQWAFGRRLSPRWRYGLWLLVVARLALPWTIPSAVSVFNLLSFPDASAAVARLRANPEPQESPAPPAAVVPAERTEDAAAAAPEATAPGFSVSLSWLLLVWAAGALALAVCLLIMHYRLWRSVTPRRPLIDAPVMNLLEDCKQAMGLRVPVTMVETGAVGSPSLFGFVRPRLLLPIGLTQSFSQEELRYVFLHELSHIKRWDILTGWLMTALQILHWFNPLVWLAFHRMRVDRELACDALALSYAKEEENQPYGRTIIKLLEGFGCSAWAPSMAGTVENKNQMKERISMIAKFRKTSRGPALAGALFIILALVTLTDAQTGGKSPAARDLVGTWILVGKPGAIYEAPPTGGRLKHITGSHWDVTQADPKTGVTIFHHGGTYSLKGNEYLFTVEYANESTANLIGHTSKFRIKIEGDTLTQIGIGNPWTEVWKRLPDGSDSAETLDPAAGSPAGSNAQAPPRIIATSPAVGAKNVDPELTEITVTFDQDMGGGMSWTGGGPEFPPSPEGQKAQWRDKRTCVLPVKLQSGHYYRVGINSTSYQNFSSEHGIAAKPSAIYFTTQGASAALEAKTQLPKIVKLSPANGAKDVSPKLKELRVTFDVPMGGGFSWCGDGPQFPKFQEGKRPFWTEGGKTCVLPVKLEPGVEYEIWLNSESHKNFQTAGGVPLEPVHYTFKTSGKATQTAQADGKSDEQQYLEKAKGGDQWAVFWLWDSYYRGNNGIKPDPAKADKWLHEFVQKVWVVRFEPVDDFTPASPQEFLERVNQYGHTSSGRTDLGTGSFFRTIKQGDKLVASFLTNYPDQLKDSLKKVPGLKVTSAEKITPEAFIKYEQSPQESL